MYLLAALTSFLPAPSGPASENLVPHRGPAQRPVSTGRASRRGGAAASAAASGGHAGDGEEGRGEAGGEAGEGQGRPEEHAGQGQRFKKNKSLKLQLICCFFELILPVKFLLLHFVRFYLAAKCFKFLLAFSRGGTAAAHLTQLFPNGLDVCQENIFTWRQS